MSSRNLYITEIDSLRALAVAVVVIFHAYPAFLTGGFIGVDVFFVVSGFVIARAYLLTLIAGEKTLRDFYIARFRRLAPALAVVLAVTSVVAVFVLLPDSLLAYSWSLLAQPVYLQNFVFWFEGNYFSGALTKPLLHTWSLAVEEQFYILLAVLILLLRRYPKALIWILIAGVVLSVAAGLVIEPRSPKTTFYHLPTRIWEFAFGILTYLVSRRFDERIAALSGWVAVLVALAIAAIIMTAVIYPESAAFPGSQSLIACGATAVVLALTGPLAHGATDRAFHAGVDAPCARGLCRTDFLWLLPLALASSYDLLFGSRPSRATAYGDWSDAGGFFGGSCKFSSG